MFWEYKKDWNRHRILWTGSPSITFWRRRHYWWIFYDWLCKIDFFCLPIIELSIQVTCHILRKIRVWEIFRIFSYASRFHSALYEQLNVLMVVFIYFLIQTFDQEPLLTFRGLVMPVTIKFAHFIRKLLNNIPFYV